MPRKRLCCLLALQKHLSAASVYPKTYSWTHLLILLSLVEQFASAAQRKLTGRPSHNSKTVLSTVKKGPTNVYGRQNRLRVVVGDSLSLGTATLTASSSLFGWA